MRTTFATHGLTLTDYSGWRSDLRDVDYACVPAALEDADIILVCVKSGATQDAAREIAEHGRDGAMVISFQNGVSNLDVLEAELGARFRIVRGMVRFNVAYLGDGHFHKGVSGDLWVEDRPETRALAGTRRRRPGGAAAVTATCSASPGASC